MPAMQYRLSTLLLIFFFFAASLATFGIAGIWITVVFLSAALAVNRAEIIASGIFAAFVASFFALPAFFWPVVQRAREAAQEVCSSCPPKGIALGLHNYHEVNKHFPPLKITDSSGRPLRSWRAEILPHLEYDALYNALNKDEPWDSPQNKKVLDQFPNETQFTRRTCAHEIANSPNTCYMAVVGPGTAWRSDRPVKFSELPNRGSNTVMLVEVADSGVHWAAPRDLTVEEALEGLRTGKGLRISTDLKTRTNVSMADGTVLSLPTKMSLSLWKKLLAGELSREEIDNINSLIEPNAPDMVDVSVAPKSFEPGTNALIAAFLVWLLSLILLFRRAIKSRKNPENERSAALGSEPTV